MRMINNEKLEIKDVQTKLKEPLEMYIDALDPDNEDEPENLDPEGLNLYLKWQKITKIFLCRHL